MTKRFYLVAGIIAMIAGCLMLTPVGSATQTKTDCVLPSLTQDTSVAPVIGGTPACPSGDGTFVVSGDYMPGSTTTTTTQPATTTTIAATTTTVATTTTLPTTTTTQPASGAFLSYPHQSAPQSFSGTNVVVSNRSYQGFTGKVALTISNAHNVYLHDLDFADNGGDIFLIGCTGQIRIENIRARNTGDGTIGSGHSNVIQLNNTWDDGTGGIRDISSYGGHTEDMISIFKSGGVDSMHPLVIEDNHLESPLPPDPLAWTSTSGTCINAADFGGHDIVVRHNTLLNCGAVGLQMNQPLRVIDYGNVVYGAARANSNVGLSQWNGSLCSTCVNNAYGQNRVWWVKSTGTASAMWISSTATVSKCWSAPTDPTVPLYGGICSGNNNVLQDTTINPNTLKVVL